MGMFTPFRHIIRDQNKNTDFLIISAWLCRIESEMRKFFLTIALRRAQ